MYLQTKELIVTSAPYTGRWHRLAVAIREGCRRAPVQCFGKDSERHSFVGHLLGQQDEACAVGAAALMGVRGSAFPHISCPACDCGDSHASHILMHLNDDHRWTREAIADWLDTL